MTAWIGLIASSADDVPQPSGTKKRMYFDVDLGTFAFKDSTGAVFPVGTEGADGPPGDPGPPGADANTYFPGGWG